MGSKKAGPPIVNNRNKRNHNRNKRILLPNKRIIVLTSGMEAGHTRMGLDPSGLYPSGSSKFQNARIWLKIGPWTNFRVEISKIEFPKTFEEGEGRVFFFIRIS